MDFYIYRSNQLEGPFTARQLHDMVLADEIDPELLCAPDGAQEWKAISEVLSPVLPKKEEAVAAEIPEILTISRSALCAQALGFLSLLCIGMVVLHRQTGYYALVTLAVPAMICGVWALMQIRRRGTVATGNGLALGGMIAAAASLLAGAWLTFSVLPAGIPELDLTLPAAGDKQATPE